MRVTFSRVTVIIPVLSVLSGFASALIRNEPFPLRVEGVMLLIVSHGTLLVGMFHTPLAVTLTLTKLATDDGDHVDMFSDRTEFAPVCVTVTVRVMFPAVTVIVPVLSFPAFGVVLIWNEPLPVWLEGVKLFTESHEDASGFTLTFHLAPDVTLIVAELEKDGGFHEFSDNVSCAVAPAWVIVTVWV